MDRRIIFTIAFLWILLSVFVLLYFGSAPKGFCCASPDENKEAYCNSILNKVTAKDAGNENYSFSPPDLCFEQGEPIVSELEGVNEDDNITYRDGEYVVVDES